MLEELGRGRPLVRFELPGLTGREDGHDAVPVVGFKVGGAVDEDEDGGFARCGGVGCGSCRSL